MITEKSNRLQVIVITDYDYPISVAHSAKFWIQKKQFIPTKKPASWASSPGKFLYKIVSKVLVLQCWSKSKKRFKYSTWHIVCYVVGNLDKSHWSVMTIQAPNKTCRFRNFNVKVMNKMEKKDCGESVRVHSMLRFSIMLIALRTTQIMINFIWNI